MDNLLVAQFYTVKQQLVGRYVNFVRKLLSSTSPEVCIVANMVARCARSTTGRNMLNIERETNLDPWTTQSWQVRDEVPRAEVPAMQGWRVQFLGKLLEARMEMDSKCQDLEEINTLMDSFCSSWISWTPPLFQDSLLFSKCKQTQQFLIHYCKLLFRNKYCN